MRKSSYQEICHPAHPDYRLDTSPFYLMAHADFAYHQDMSKVLSRHGVDRSIYRIMTVLREQQPANIGLLAERALMKRNTASRVVERMEERGLVRTDGNPKDSRATDVVLTQRGTALLNTLTPIIGLRFQRAVEGLGEEGLKQLVLLLQKVGSNLNRPARNMFGEVALTGHPQRLGRLPAGQVWAASVGGSVQMVRIEVSQGAGSGIRLATKSPAGLRAALKKAAQYLHHNAVTLVGRQSLKGLALLVTVHSLEPVLTASNAPVVGSAGGDVSLGLLLALCSSLLKRPLRTGLLVPGGLDDETHAARVEFLELAVLQGARAVLLPLSSRRAVVGMSDDVAAQLEVIFHAGVEDAMRKALRD